RIWDRVVGPPVGLDGPGPDMLTARNVPCRVQELKSAGEGSAVPAGQEVTERRYLITVPVKTPVHFKTGTRGHQIEVTDVREDGDPMLVGRRFDVIQVMTGSEVWERDLVCIDNQTQNEKGGDEDAG
ncbi:DUF6093 family protein, partial [uncultured Kocuria sp.]|uniref:DUF6093 family protein n=1 Tax=uncultured Kocuria sp. TaxID=259305 RepID=UPI0025966E45